jgi:membrane protease YdiL (CAAX protease family)
VTLLVAAAEPSKVAFYVAGSLFVVWAVALAAVGLTVPEFPYGKLGQRAVVLVSLLLAAAAIATAIITEK